MEQSLDAYNPLASHYNQQFNYNAPSFTPQYIYTNQSSPVPPQSQYYNSNYSYYANTNGLISPNNLSPTYPFSNINNYNNNNATYYNYLCPSNTTHYHNSFSSSTNNDSAYQSQSEFISPNTENSDLNVSKFVSTPVNAQKVLNKKRKRLNDSESDSDQIKSIETINETVIEVKSKRPKVLKLNFAKSQSTNAFGPGETESLCSICNLAFYSTAKLLMHQHKFHKNGSSTECPVCFKKFGNHANTLVHLRAHTQEKTYKCTSCTQAFCDASTLKKHLRVHSGEKPYVCSICSKRFTQSGNLKRHIVVHQKYDGQRNTSSQENHSRNHDVEPYFNQSIKQEFEFDPTVRAQYNFLNTQLTPCNLTEDDQPSFFTDSYSYSNDQYRSNTTYSYQTTF